MQKDIILDDGGGGSFKGFDTKPPLKKEESEPEAGIVEVTTNKSTASPNEKDKAAKYKAVSLRAMMRFAEPFDYFLMVTGAIAAMANGGSLAAFSFIFGALFDALNSADKSGAINTALLFVYVGFGAFVGGTLQVGCFTMASERMTIKLRRAYMNSLLDQEVGYFDQAGAGTLSSRVSESALLFREALGEKFGALFQFGATFVGGLIVGFYYLWQLALLILGITPLFAISGYFMNVALNLLVGGQLESYAQAGAVAEESISLIRTVTALNAQESQFKKYDAELAVSVEKAKKQGKAIGFGFGSTMGVYFASYALTFYVGAVLIANSKTEQESKYPLTPGNSPGFCVVNGLVPANCTAQLDQVGTLRFATAADVCGCAFCNCGCYFNVTSNFANESKCVSGGDIVLTFFAVLIGSFALGQAAPSLTALSRGRVAAAALYEVIDRKPLINDDNADKDESKPLSGDIVFQNVAFAYPTRLDFPIFKDLNLKIGFGKRVALVGQSGSGKSTIIGLIQRYYDPAAGTISIGGRDIRTVTLKKLRDQMGLVSQEPILFATSIKENIRYGRQDVSDEELERACRDANCHDFIMKFPSQYDTFVGASGSQLSGGQKQRISIARALIRNPPILLLDEATAALDNESEKLVNEAIGKIILSGTMRTTIVIAHRLTSIEKCDEILVLERGVLIEQGTHAELAGKPNGMYASLLKLSTSEAVQKKVRNSMQLEADKKQVIANPQNGDDAGEDAAKKGEAIIELEHPIVGGLMVPRKQGERAIDPDQSTLLHALIPENERSDTQDSNKDGAGAKKKKKKEKKIPISRAFEFAYPERFLFIPGTIAQVANGISFPIFALLFAEVLPVFYYTNNTSMLYQVSIWSLAFLGLAVGVFLALLVSASIFGYISGVMTVRVRQALFRQLLRQEIGFFDEKDNSVGNLTSKLASDAGMLKAAVVDRLEVAISNIATLAAGFVIAFIASWKLSLVVLGVFPLMALAGAMQFWVMSGLAGADKKELALAQGTLGEAVGGIRTVTAFGMKPKVQQLYFEQLLGPLKKATRKGFVGGLGFGFSQGVMFWAYGLTFWYGTTLLIAGEITFKDLNQSLFGIMMSAMALGQATAMAPDLAKGSDAVQTIYELLDRKSKIDALSEEGEKPSTVKGDITFENVSFSYPTRPELPIFEKLNITIGKGQTVAFVGQSGSGKSTIIQLIERFYDPISQDESSGTVYLDGKDLRKLNPQWLRSNIGLVSQEPVLFNTTILENIRSGNLNASDEDCIRAAKDANAYDFTMALPQQFQTICGAKGNQLSGGMKQRVAIARALIRNPPILLLDEATSALDEESQKIVQNALDVLLEKSMRTTIIVAHRLSTIKNADVIVVLERGRIIETGQFNELMARNGPFAMLARAQES